MFNGVAAYITLYVDDLALAISGKSNMQTLKQAISKLLPVKDLGELKNYLGLQFSYNSSQKIVKIHQARYIDTLLTRTNMLDACTVKIPMNPSVRTNMLDACTVKIPMNPDMSPQTAESIRKMDNVPYRQTVGSLLYLVSGSRPDIANAVGQVCRYMQNPGQSHWTAVKHILKYLKGTRDHGVIFGR